MHELLLLLLLLSSGKRMSQGMCFLGRDCLEAEYQEEHTDLARWKLAKLRRSKTKFKRSRGSSDQVLGLWFFSMTAILRGVKKSLKRF